MRKSKQSENSRNIEAARILRQEMTPAEKRLWPHVRNRQLGYKIRRQYPIIGTPYVGDFCCADAHLIIEIDGSIHAEQVEEDANRQTIIESLGFTFIRFTNQQVFQDLEGVLDAIKARIEALIEE